MSFEPNLYDFALPKQEAKTATVVSVDTSEKTDDKIMEYFAAPPPPPTDVPTIVHQDESEPILVQVSQSQSTGGHTGHFQFQSDFNTKKRCDLF